MNLIFIILFFIDIPRANYASVYILEIIEFVMIVCELIRLVLLVRLFDDTMFFLGSEKDTVMVLIIFVQIKYIMALVVNV